MKRLRNCLSLLLFLCLSWGGAQEILLEQRVFEISRQLRCPTCRSESVADSSAGISLEMRQIVQDQLQEGRTEAEILAFFRQRYGDWILLEPPREGLHLIVWIAPIVGAILALLALVYYMRRWTLNARVPLELDPDDLRRVRQELERRS